MSDVPAKSEDRLLQQANQTSDESEEEGVPVSRGAHIGTGLATLVFGGFFGGIPLGIYITTILEGAGAIELVLMGLFFSPFILIGIPTFTFGVVSLGAGIIGYPLIKSYDDEDEEGTDGEPVSTAFAYISEDDILEQIHRTKTLEPAPSTASNEVEDQPAGGFWNIEHGESSDD